MSGESDDFRRVQDVTQEDLEQENQNVTHVPAIPVYWKDGVTGKTHVQSSAVVRPTGKDVEVFGAERQTVCGQCKYFDLEKGRVEIIRQRFGERLVREYEWQIKHLGAPIESIGLCGASGGATATSFTSKSCDQFRPRRI